MAVGKDGGAPTSDCWDSPAPGQVPRGDGLAWVTRPALRVTPGVPPSMTAHLARLRAAFPAFSFSIRPGWRGQTFEAWREPTAAGLYAVITNDASELWHELEQFQARCESAALRTPATRDLR
jgi:hypothetical protein